MNLDRVAPRANEPGLRRTESPAGPFDLTISDRGVQSNNQAQAAKRGRLAPREEATTSLNSTAALGQMLSVEESSALREAFAPEARAGVYTIRGQAARAAQGIAQGGLLDVTG